MEGNTPRTLIRGILQTSEATRSSPRRGQRASSSSSTTSGSTSRRGLSKEKSLFTSQHQPISSEKVSSSVKRPAQGSLTRVAKRQRSLMSTPSETITPRTNIRAFLAAADSKSPEKSSETSTSHYQLTRSAISDRQVQKLISSECRSRRTMPRKSARSQSFQTPRESITPREAIKIYLNAADTEPQTSRQSTLNKRNTGAANMEDSTEERQEDSEIATGKDDPPESQERKGESADESGDESVGKRDESGAERIESGDKNVESGDETVDSGDEKAAYGDENGGLEHGTEFQASPQHVQEMDYAPVKYDKMYESSHKPIVDSSQDKRDMGSSRNRSDERKQDPSQEDTSSQDDEINNSAVNQSRLIGSLQEGKSWNVTDVTNRSARARRSGEWAKLRTPVLPDTTIAKATPVVLGKPPIPAQQKKARNIKNTLGKQKQVKPRRKDSPVMRLPSSLVNGIFRHFSALRVSKDALDAVQVGSDAFFEHIATDLHAYSKHAKRKTIEESDVELLMRRQGLVKSKESFHALIEKYLPLEYRQELIPAAKSGNKVIPKEKT